MARLVKDSDGWPVLLAADQPPAKPGRWARIAPLRKTNPRDQTAEQRRREPKRARSV
jgi:hypothetical protein